MKNIRLFDTQAEYNAATLDYPNVAYVKETDKIIMKGDPVKEYLNFTATNGDATIGMSGSATPNVSYSFDKNTWTTWDYSNVTIPNGSTLYVKGTNTTMQNKKFTMSGSIAANGNVMSLLYGDNFFGQLTIPSNNCFKNAFNGCTSLTSAPQLPATTLTQSCYDSMFRDCTSLTSAPQLPATTLASSCYRGMFNGCANLNYIKMMATDISASSCLLSWVQGVAASGTFVKNSAAQWDESGASGVPNNWTIEYADA